MSTYTAPLLKLRVQFVNRLQLKINFCIHRYKHTHTHTHTHMQRQTHCTYKTHAHAYTNPYSWVHSEARFVRAYNSVHAHTIRAHLYARWSMDWVFAVSWPITQSLLTPLFFWYRLPCVLSFFLCLFLCLFLPCISLLSQCTDDQHDSAHTVYLSADDDDFVQR